MSEPPTDRPGPLVLRIVIDPAPIEPSDDYQIRVEECPPGYRVGEPSVTGQHKQAGRMAIRFSTYLEPITEEKKHEGEEGLCRHVAGATRRDRPRGRPRSP